MSADPSTGGKPLTPGVTSTADLQERIGQTERRLSEHHSGSQVSRKPGGRRR